jgi:signal transduction histidine kinase
VAARQLARSIDDVLDMAQIDAGEMELSRAEVPLVGRVAGKMMSGQIDRLLVRAHDVLVVDLPAFSNRRKKYSIHLPDMIGVGFDFNSPAARM